MELWDYFNQINQMFILIHSSHLDFKKWIGGQEKQ